MVQRWLEMIWNHKGTFSESQQYTQKWFCLPSTPVFVPVWTGLKKEKKKYSREVANMQPPKVVNGYVQGAITPGIELTGESRLTFCKTC